MAATKKYKIQKNRVFYMGKPGKRSRILGDGETTIDMTAEQTKGQEWKLIEVLPESKSVDKPVADKQLKNPAEKK